MSSAVPSGTDVSASDKVITSLSCLWPFSSESSGFRLNDVCGSVVIYLSSSGCDETDTAYVAILSVIVKLLGDLLYGSLVDPLE